MNTIIVKRWFGINAVKQQPCAAAFTGKNPVEQGHDNTKHP